MDRIALLIRTVGLQPLLMDLLASDFPCIYPPEWTIKSVDVGRHGRATPFAWHCKAAYQTDACDALQ